MQTTNSKKMLIWILVAILAIGAIWFLFFRNTGEKEIFYDEFGNPIEAQVVGKDLIDVLSELQAVTLDASIFQSPGFRALSDNAIELPNEPRGKNNPFEKLPGSSR